MRSASAWIGIAVIGIGAGALAWRAGWFAGPARVLEPRRGAERHVEWVLVKGYHPTISLDWRDRWVEIGCTIYVRPFRYDMSYGVRLAGRPRHLGTETRVSPEAALLSGAAGLIAHGTYGIGKRNDPDAPGLHVLSYGGLDIESLWRSAAAGGTLRIESLDEDALDMTVPVFGLAALRTGFDAACAGAWARLDSYDDEPDPLDQEEPVERDQDYFGP